MLAGAGAQFFTDSGVPLSGGLIYTYAAGTTTPQAAYTTSAGNVAHANPIVLNSAGRVASGGEIWLTDAVAYKFVLQTSTGVTIATYDNVTGNASGIYAAFAASSGSSLVGFIQSGTGAVATTVQGRLRQTVSVLDFGASPSNLASANNTAFAAAMTYAATISGAVYVPAGTYQLSATLTKPSGVSIFGVGTGSILVFTGCNGITLAYDSASYETTGLSTFIRDIQIFGSNATTSSYSGIIFNYTAASGRRCTGISFDNVVVKDFQTGGYFRQLWNCNFINCNFINSYYGIYFYGQNIKNSITNCFFQKYTMTGTGGSWGISFQTVDGESTQSTQIFGSQIYSFDIGINILLGFEIQIEHNDITECQSIGVNIVSTNGGCWVRDNWIQTNKAALTYGVYIAALATINYQDVHVIANHIVAQTPYVGSTGIYVRTAQYGATINDNAIYKFDIGFENVSSTNVTFKFNKIDVLTSVYNSSSKAVILSSASNDNEIGPNAIIPGDPSVNTSFYQATTMTGSSANIGVTNSAYFPAGTQVQFASTNNGFIAGITYYVLTSSANVITVAANSSGSAIAATGVTANFVFATPYPLTFTTTTCPPGLTFFGRGSFMSAITGFTTALGGRVDWVASGKIVSITINNNGTWNGTSNAATMTMTGMPDFFLNPVYPQYAIANIINNNTGAYGIAYIHPTTGVITFYSSPASGSFVASGTKGVVATAPIVYQLS